ncbi:hypothetical protein EJB05_40278, partial [Eragrostis curvula]
MHPRSRTRCRDLPPPPSGGGGRHRRRSPPPPSPRHQRRPPPPPQRRSPDRAPPPRRHEEIPIPTIPNPGAADRRSRADILLEAGRLAAHYLVAQGVIPDHLLRAREDPNHTPAPRPEPPAPASYGRKRDEDDDPRWRRSGDWGRAKGDEDRQSRRSGWDRRSHSFDDRRKYSAAAAAAADVARRTRDYDEPKRPPMSRSYSHNDRRASGDGRGDPRRRSRSRSRSRSRTRTRSYHHGGSRRDSDGRPSSRDLDHTKPPDSVINPADAEMPRKPKVPSSVVVAEVNHSADRPMGTEDGEMESEMVGLDHPQDVSEEDGEFAEDISEEEDGEFAEDVSEEEDGEFADDGFNDEDGAEMDATERQLSDVDVPPSESIEEPVHMQSQLSNAEVEMEAGAAPMDDACMVEPSAAKDGSSEPEAPQSEVETGVGDVNRDEQELPSWYRIFDLNVVETPEGFEMPVISGDSPADHVSDSATDLSGQMNQQAKYGSSEVQGQDEHAVANDLLKYGRDLSKYDLNNVADGHEQEDTSNIHAQDEDAGDDLMKDEQDLNKCDLNHEADAHTQDNHLLNNEEILLSHGMPVEDSDDCRLSNEQMLLKQNADEGDPKDDDMENEQMLANQGTPGQVLDIHYMTDEQLMLSDVTDEQLVNKHHMEPEPTPLPMGVHDVDSNDLKGEQMLLNNGTNNEEEDTCRLKDGEILLDQAVDGQARVCDMGNGRPVPVIDLEDDCKQQPDTRDTGEFLESISDQQTSSFPDKPHANIQAVSSSSVAPNFGNRCTGRGAVNSEVIPGDDDAPYVAFDKMPLEVINVWDLPSSELGKSS